MSRAVSGTGYRAAPGTEAWRRLYDGATTFVATPSSDVTLEPVGEILRSTHDIATWEGRG